ncbi:MAG: hypothetical protein Q8L48_38435 [Archangium sp.]|nr:hypothetical protein [Archangium sp.]
MNSDTLSAPASLKTVLPWLLTLALLSVWAYGVLTANSLGGFANGALISGAVMLMVSLIAGQRSIASSP